HLLFIVLFVALVAMALAVPVEKRGDGPMLALPESKEPIGTYLGRLISPLPLIGPVTALLGLPAPK
ncbi:hypothetical protein LPJ75_003480, partial [Coemansia sp. RSA 2598]